jgi:hypothetical protein
MHSLTAIFRLQGFNRCRSTIGDQEMALDGGIVIGEKLC